HGTQTENLKPAGVGQNRTLPMQELMQTTVATNHFATRAQHQVKGVSENDFSTDFLELLGRHCLDGTVSAYRHECWRLHPSARKDELALSSSPDSAEDMKLHRFFRC